MSFGKNGILLINKSPGLTSFETISKMKRIVGIKKIGHTGTLDKFAEGLLVILLGKFTKLASIITGMDKEYIAEIHFGSTTETLDPEGLVVDTGPVPEIAQIRKSIKKFEGEIDQVPPLYSAVHHQGERAYKLVRKGIIPELKSRKIAIHKIDIIKYESPYLFLKINCSKGTYIRSLARDLGKALGTCGYVKSLKRTEVGRFKLADAQTLDELKLEKKYISPLTLPELTPGTDRLTIKNEYQPVLLNGGHLAPSFFLEEKNFRIEIDKKYFIFNEKDELVAFVEARNSILSYITVLGKSGM